MIAFYGAQDQPMDVQRRYQWQQIADLRPGWSMDYIRSMSQAEVIDFYAYMDVKARLAQKQSKKR